MMCFVETDPLVLGCLVPRLTFIAEVVLEELCQNQLPISQKSLTTISQKSDLVTTTCMCC